MSLRGLPDWNQPLVTGAAFAAHERHGTWFAAPDQLEPAATGGLVVDRFTQDRLADGGIVRYGVHTLRWRAASRLGESKAPPGTIPAGVPPRPLPFDAGVVRLTGPAVLRAAHTGEPALGEAFALDQAGLATFVAVLGLDDASTEMVLEAHRRGTALIGADAVLVAHGVAVRHPAVVELELAAFREALGEEEVEVDRLGERIAKTPEALGFRFVSGAPADDVATARAAAAVLDRVVARLATPLAPPRRDPEALALGARIPPRVRIAAPDAGKLRWDLSEPVPAPRLFAMASSAMPTDGGPAEVHEHSPPTLSSGWHRLEVTTTAVPPWAGALLGFDVDVPPNPPARPQRVRTTEFFTDSARASVDLRLAPTEALSGTVTGTLVLDSGEQVSGEPIALVRETVLLRTDAFPANFVPLELSGELSGCAVTVEWSRAGAVAEASARLDSDVGRVVLVAPPAEDATLRVQAVTADGRTATVGDLPVAPLLVDAFLFPGTGSVTVPVEVKFVGASPAPLAVELVAEGAEDDAGALALRNLAPAHPRSEWTRFVASPFATGYRWRIAGNPDWSEVVREPSGTPLRLTAAGGDVRREKEDDMDDEEFSAAGLRLVRTGDPGGREWAFLPETPAIATQPGGEPSLSLVEAGELFLLTLTGRLTANDEQRLRAREELAQRSGVAPGEVVLRPATLAQAAASVTLTLDGATTELAASTTSGSWPYNAAMQAQLTTLQADAVRRALGGERGLLNLHYGGELRAGEVESRISSSSSSSSSVSTTVTSTTRAGDGPTVTASSSTQHSETGGRDVAPPAPTARTVAIDLDGADWARRNR